MVKVRFHYCCNVVGSDDYEDLEFTQEELDAMSEEDLAEMAAELALDRLEPQGWYEVLNND